jgi:CRP/FNR family cyclic AMP-dependent transcriptional regulator
MASGMTSAGVQARMEDVLAHLPISGIATYSKGETIYGPDDNSANVYLVVEGKVSISQVAGQGSEVLLDIVRPEELFGESAFLDATHRTERAVAMEKTRLMSWAASDLEELVMKRPRLAVALLQILARRNAEYTLRVESFANDNIERRLARSLLHFSERLGTREEDGSVRMMPFTHVLLSQYVGTSREIVTHYMNRFRRLGYMSYSRQGIHLYCDTLKTMLDGNHYLPARSA